MTDASAHTNNTASRLIRLQDVRLTLEKLRSERDQLIRDTDGEVGVRELARFLDMSPAQISRIRLGVQR